jgi:hypothetical protein
MSAAMETWAGETTPEDAAATVTLLRTPAAIAAAFFLGGAVVGQAMWSTATPEATAFAVLRCLAVALVCVPFLLPSRWYQPGRTMMRVWIVAAGIAATLRAIDLCVSLFPLPAREWLTAVAVQVAILSALWVAVVAVRRAPPG